jgi:hypothetical protein
MRRSNVSRIRRWLEHVLELAGVLPPALHQMRPHLEAAVDEILDRVGDLQLVAEAGLDGLDRVEDLRAEHVDATSARFDRRLGLLHRRTTWV